MVEEARERSSCYRIQTMSTVGMQTNLGPSSEPMACPYQNLFSGKPRGLLGVNPFVIASGGAKNHDLHPKANHSNLRNV